MSIKNESTSCTLSVEWTEPSGIKGSFNVLPGEVKEINAGIESQLKISIKFGAMRKTKLIECGWRQDDVVCTAKAIEEQVRRWTMALRKKNMMDDVEFADVSALWTR
jgi:hypothetical protein